jgi:hypothetical protein
VIIDLTDAYSLSFHFSKIGLSLSEFQLNPSPELEISTSGHLQTEASTHSVSSMSPATTSGLFHPGYLDLIKHDRNRLS